MIKKIILTAAICRCFCTGQVLATDLDQPRMLDSDYLWMQQASAKLQRKALKKSERDRMWNEMHFCIKKMYICLEKADKEAQKIQKVNIRRAVRSAISGAIAGLSTRDVYGVLISSCLSTLGNIAADSYSAFADSRELVLEAKYFAFRADELQEILWTEPWE